MQVTGSCHCGTIEFTAIVDPSKVMVCHCTDCQKLTGSAFRIVVPAPIESFVLNGEPKRYVKVAASGVKRVQAFCPECGSPVFAAALENPTQVNIRVGLLDQRQELPPIIQIWKQSSLPWVSSLSSVQGCAQQAALNLR